MIHLNRMKEPLYRDVIHFGWQFAWKHKFLWVYGLFAAMLGQIGMFEMLAKASTAVVHASGGVQLYVFRFPHLFVRGLFSDAGSAIGPDWVWLVWLLLVGVGLLAMFAVVAVVSQGALIHAAAQGKDSGSVAMDSREWHAGVDHFWRLFFLNAAKKICIAFLAGLVGVAAFAAIASPTAGNLLLFLALFLLSVALGTIFSFFVMYAAGYIVVEEYDLGHALSAAWRLFWGHWLVSLEVGLVFVLLNTLVAVVALLGFFILLLPAGLLWIIALFAGNIALFVAAIVFLFFCFIAFMMFVGSVFTVFSTAVWTHLFMHMHRYGVKSRILHWLTRR